MASQIEDIKSAIDIVQLIGERVHLTKAGKNYKGLCPFHSEKTPSFFVTPEIERYKCFGCGKSGDIFTFLEEYDSLTFAEALQTLADRAGIALEKHIFNAEDVHRKRLLEVLSLAREYYHYLLTDHRLGEPARTYLKNRGIAQETIKTFMLGFALNSWDALQDFLITKKKYTQRELEDVGLVILKSGARDAYDRFRGRIMFPLTDAQGRVVGFSGRVLDAVIKEAKYINSPETSLYHKSELLFGYAVLKNIIRQEEEVIVVEGELDALSSYQAGVKNVVAIKGSALTEKQIKLLARSVKRLVLALDADSAGVEATKRAIETAKPFELSLRVLPLMGGKDPDDIARQSPKAWREMAKKTISVYEFLIDAAFAKHADAAQTGEGKRLITVELVPMLAGIANGVEQAHYLDALAKKLAVKSEVLEKEVNKYQQKKTLNTHAKSAREPEKNEPKNLPQLEVLERYLLGLVLHSEPEETAARINTLQAEHFTTPLLDRLLSQLRDFLKKRAVHLETFAKTLPEELKQPLSDIYLELDESDMHLEKEWKITLLRWQEAVKTQNMQKLAEHIARLEEKEIKTSQEEEQLITLQQQFVRLSAQPGLPVMEEL